ncbi:MAG TPA: type II toxin-antitoxin system ParD family antitoxin [Acidobacteriaceae bacterium]|nr:type II toxin-antitoxin system ParD family antitoxin [Acidobacteriaceae bacterium]
MPSSYAIGDHFEHFIRQQIESGRYASASEVVREALRTLEGRERLREIEIEEYRAKIQEGLGSPALPAEDIFTRLEAKYQAMLDPQA